MKWIKEKWMIAVKFARLALLRSMKWGKENWASILNWLIAILVIALVVTARVMWNHKDGTDGIYEFLRDVASAFLLLIGAFALLRRAAPQDKIAEADFQSNQQTIFKDGINFLDSDVESVRLGGIYSLYELAIQDPKRSKEILEILCAHIRSKTNEAKYQDKYKNGPSVEISSLLKLLTSKESALRKAVEENKEGEYILKFRGAFLNGANLYDAWLIHADLSHSQLQEVSFTESQMNGANLSHAQMQNAWLKEAEMQGAHLWKAQMQGADFLLAQMQRADLWGAQMQGAQFTGVLMQEINLQDAHMQRVELSGAWLQGADLSRAQMQGAFLEGAQMHGAELCEAQMQGADLKNAQLQAANLSNAILHGANLEGAQLQISQLNNAKLQGAVLKNVQLQGADLDGMDLRGASVYQCVEQPVLGVVEDSDKDSIKYEGLKSCMKLRRGKSTELDNTVIFAGKFNSKDELNKILQESKEYFRDADDNIMLEWIESRQRALQKFDDNTPTSYEIPKGVITGVLNDDEVDKIIEEYEKAMAWEQDDAESG